MNFNDPSEFGKAYRALCVDDAQQIHAAFEADQLADEWVQCEVLKVGTGFRR